MKISTSLGHGISIGKVSAAESALMMKKAGFHGVDLSLCEYQTEPWKILTDEWKAHVMVNVNALRAAGLEVAQTHMPFYYAHLKHPGSGTYQEYEDFLLPAYIRALETTAEVGGKIAVMHPYYIEDSVDRTRYGNYKLIEKMMPTLEKYNLKIALENVWAEGYKDTHMSYPEDMLKVVETIGSEHVGLCIDTGHANIFNIHIGNMARTFGKHLYALHMNGNSGKADSHTVPYSMSGWCENMDYLDFSAALKEIGYKGYYNMEVANGDLPPQVAQPFYNYVAAVAQALAGLAE